MKVLVVGASWSHGYGLDGGKDDPKLWVNQLVCAAWPNATITNIAQVGKNNDWIFTETISELLKNSYDIVIVGWSVIPRWITNVGLELYATDTHFSDMDINLHNNETVTGRWLSDIGDRLRKIHNDHWDFLKLVKYVNALINLQENVKSGRIFFVDVLGPWSKNYFDRKNITRPSDLTVYEQDLLDVGHRNDTEIIKLYNLIHDQYEQEGGIRESNWLNLYRSLLTLQVDATPDRYHPGYRSQDIYAQTLIPTLKSKL
jgi:hypothetical protein